MGICRKGIFIFAQDKRTQTEGIILGTGHIQRDWRNHPECSSIYLFIILHALIYFVCMHAYVHKQVTAHTWRPEDNSQKLVLLCGYQRLNPSCQTWLSHFYFCLCMCAHVCVGVFSRVGVRGQL